MSESPPDRTTPDPTPDQSTDDTDLGWGEAPDVDMDDDERFLRDKPPHY
jgi:hypothetical protein